VAGSTSSQRVFASLFFSFALFAPLVQKCETAQADLKRIFSPLFHFGQNKSKWRE
jgi:hypothetical protein